MHLDVSGQNIEVSDALRDYARSKVERVENHLDQVIDGHVVLSVQRHLQFAEVTLRVGGTTLHAEAEADDMYAAIDDMADKLDRQARRFQDKRKDHHSQDADDAWQESTGSPE